MKSSPRRVLTILGIGTAVSLLGDSTLYTVLPDPKFALQAAVPIAQVGILLGANRLVRILFNAPVGGLIDRFPRRSLMIGSLVVGSLSTLTYAIGHGFWVMLAGRILWGAAWSGLWIGGQAIVLDLADNKNRGRLSGRYQTWFFLGIGLSAFLGGLFTDLLGYRGGLLLSAGLTVAAAFMWLFLLPETAPRQSEKRRGDQGAGGRFRWRVALVSAIPIFTVRFIFAGVIAATSILWLSGFADDGVHALGLFIPIATLTGAFVALRTTFSMLGAPVTGFISDRIHGRRWIIIGTALMIGAAGLWLMGSPFLPLALFGVLLSALTASGVQALTTAYVGDNTPPNLSGRTLSVIFTFGDLGSALGPPLAFWLLLSFPLATIFRLCALVSLAASIFAFALRSDQKYDR
ncbi:MAG TPA: MFS transporter [Anaerolineales bacterium]|nr:MFS transporter [Anaerolineales bacterium]